MPLWNVKRKLKSPLVLPCHKITLSNHLFHSFIQCHHKKKEFRGMFKKIPSILKIQSNEISVDLDLIASLVSNYLIDWNSHASFLKCQEDENIHP